MIFGYWCKSKIYVMTHFMAAPYLDISPGLHDPPLVRVEPYRSGLGERGT